MRVTSPIVGWLGIERMPSWTARTEIASAKNPRKWPQLFDFLLHSSSRHGRLQNCRQSGSHIGSAVRLNITGPCGRCVMTTLPQGDLPKDTGVLRTAAQHNSAVVGVYAEVVQGGTI